jgi:hypothetical protein
VTQEAMLRCPECGRESREKMPENACVHFFTCPGCHTVLRPRAGECCVFCSYADAICPPRQRGIGPV